MDAIDRRSALRGMLCVVVVAGCSATLLPATAEAMPLALQKDLATKTDDLTHKAQAVVVGPPRRPLPARHRRRRRRRWECWWRRGRRVCGYRGWR
jgi:hypothetical protein